MAENLDKLIAKYNAAYAFHNSGESVKSAGERDIDNDAVKQAVVVLKQSVDTAEIEDLDRISFYSGDEKMTFIFKGDDVLGILTKSDIRDIVVEEQQRDNKKEQGKVKLKERKKIAVKAPKKEDREEKKEEVKEEQASDATQKSSTYKTDASVIATVKKVAEEYLEDFAEDIVNNMMKESKLTTDNLNSDTIAQFLKKLTKSSSLIIGPTQANEMIDKINKQITE